MTDKPKHIYLIGPVLSRRRAAADMFDEAANLLVPQGWQVVNPLVLPYRCENKCNGTWKKMGYAHHNNCVAKHHLVFMLMFATHAMVFLGWKSDTLSTLEHDVAKSCGITIMDHSYLTQFRVQHVRQQGSKS